MPPTPPTPDVSQPVDVVAEAEAEAPTEAEGEVEAPGEAEAAKRVVPILRARVLHVAGEVLRSRSTP